MSATEGEMNIPKTGKASHRVGVAFGDGRTADLSITVSSEP
jgi:hypothetical protein